MHYITGHEIQLDGIEGGIQDLILSDCHTNNSNGNKSDNNVNDNINDNEDDDVEGKEFQKVIIILIYCPFYYTNVCIIFIYCFLFCSIYYSRSYSLVMSPPFFHYCFIFHSLSI